MPEDRGWRGAENAYSSGLTLNPRREQDGVLRASHLKMMLADADVDALAERVIGCAIEVHRTLGPGLLESVYRECLLIELRLAALRVEVENRLAIEYKGHRIADALKIDLLVEGRLVLELKAVERLHPIFQAQAITYLKLTGCPAGLILNFNAETLVKGLRRVDHPDRYHRRQSTAR